MEEGEKREFLFLKNGKRGALAGLIVMKNSPVIFGGTPPAGIEPSSADCEYSLIA